MAAFLRGVLVSAILALFTMLVIAGLASGRVVNHTPVRFFLFLAWWVGTSGIMLALLFLPSPSHRKIIPAMMTSLALGGSLIWLSRWIETQGIDSVSSTQNQKLPSIVQVAGKVARLLRLPTPPQ